MVEEEIVQFVWTYEVFCLLSYVALFVGRDELRTDWGVEDVEQDLLRTLIDTAQSHPLDEILDQSLWDAHIDRIHRHVVAIVGAPAEGKLREVASADNDAACLVAHIHEYLCALASLTVLVSHVVNRRIDVEVLEVLIDRILDADLLRSDAEALHQSYAVVIGAS